MISYEHSNEDTLEMWLTLVKALHQILRSSSKSFVSPTFGFLLFEVVCIHI